MNCPHCHAELPDGSKFCSQCGTALAAGAVTLHPSRGPEIFSESEVSILLDINRTMARSGGKQVSVSQDDIDKLFG